MPNTQTSVPAFVAAQVLTAQQQTEINTGIPVFATTVTRDAAFGGANEKVLAEGQFAYIEATNTTQYYDGAAWQSVAGSSGLTLISSTTIGSAVSSVTVTGAFSSTYDNYKITVIGGVSSASNIEIGMILGSTTTGYYRFLIYGAYTSNTINGSATANGASWAHAASGTSTMLNGEIELYAPNLAKKTIIVNRNSSTDTGGSGVWQNGFLNDSTQYTAFTLAPFSGTLTGGTIRVYGYQNS